MRLAAVDRWVIGYSALASLAALLFAADPKVFAGSHLLHAGAILAVLAVARFMPVSGRVWPLLRHGYPMLLFGFFYRDAEPYIFLFFSHWFDPALLAFEKSILGVSLPAVIASAKPSWLLDFFMFGYATYYLMLPLAFAVALVKRQPELFRRMMVATCAVFFASYALFALFPLEGPRYALLSVLPPISGGPVFRLVMAIQNAGSIHGGCMPSSHAAVAWVITFYVGRMTRSLGRMLIVVTTLLSVGCMWGRFHYLTDVIVGLALFAAAVVLTEWYHLRSMDRAKGTLGSAREMGAACIP